VVVQGALSGSFRPHIREMCTSEKVADDVEK
jgi:hypothetical protein